MKRIVCDEQGTLAHHFQIVNTPMAVELDADLQITRYGLQEQDGSGDSTTRPMWPDDRPMSGAGFARVDTPVSCVLTRFRLNSPLSILPFYLAFRRIRRDARVVGGLLKATFLLEGARTCYTLSLWKDDWSIVEFGRIQAHIHAANSAFGATYRRDANRSEIWSAQFRLWAVSAHNLDWKNLDMKAVLGEQWSRREQLVQKMALGKEQRIA